MLKISIHDMSLDINDLNLKTYLPGANELKCPPFEVETNGYVIMTSSNESIFRLSGPLCGGFTGHLWIPLINACDAELWCFLWAASEQTVE